MIPKVKPIESESDDEDEEDGPWGGGALAMTAPRSRVVVGAPSGGSAGAPVVRPRGPTTVSRPAPTPIIKKPEPTKEKSPAKEDSGSDYDDDFDEGG
jgi:hypothetical protein